MTSHLSLYFGKYEMPHGPSLQQTLTLRSLLPIHNQLLFLLLK